MYEYYEYDPFVYFEDKTIVATKVIMVSDVYHAGTSLHKTYGFSILIEGLSTPLQYTSDREELVKSKHRNFLANLQKSLKVR